MGWRSVRGVTSAAALTVILAVVAAPGAGAATRQRPAVATLAASPDSELADGQAVTVTASGFPTHATLDLVECVSDQGCDLSVIQVHDSGDTGGYTATFFVRRLLTLDGGVQVDCAVAQNCILVSLDISDLSTGAQTAITFDPNSPFKPPLHFRVAVDPNGRVRVDKGVARITGTVHCNQPVDIGLQVELTQVYQQQVFQSYGFVDVLCTGETRFSAVFRPGNGLFGEGAAKLHVDAFGFTTTQYETSKNVKVNLVPSTT